MGSQDSIPSRIKPIAIMQTNMGKTPFSRNICQRERLCPNSAFDVFSLFSALPFKTMLIATIKIIPTTILKTVDVKKTALNDIKEIQIGAYRYKTIVETCAVCGHIFFVA